ncbi:hypothetical protein NliqN6_1010 [Naganishia liquefaciens]|uniref:Guided entry of tail-anchored proteins 1 n=1 Tax=Naganishia liquefaciens TaxID=104408 RepID=A0A8H3YCW7_9TREE|nr:hypothetical protein NliqN6_1010 [Naganishia liquefaciens]
MQLALRILAVVLLGSVLSWIGRPALASRAFALYASLVLKPTRARQREIQRQLGASKAELRATSRQEQFTEWSRLRKQVDRDSVDLETTKTALASHRARFDQVFSALFFAVTSGAQWGIVWWYRRQPVVWMPAGWMPAYAESLLNVGGAPKGAVSVTIWSIVCKRVIDLFREIVIQWVAGPLLSQVDTWRTDKQPELVQELD